MGSCPANAVAGALNDVPQTRTRRTLKKIWTQSWGISQHKCEAYFVFHPYFAKVELEREEQLAARLVCALICAATDNIDVAK